MSEITAPMGGKVIEVKVKPGDTVNEDDEVVILEAMKMETEIRAHKAGTIGSVTSKAGDTVVVGDVLLTIA